MLLEHFLVVPEDSERAGVQQLQGKARAGPPRQGQQGSNAEGAGPDRQNPVQAIAERILVLQEIQGAAAQSEFFHRQPPAAAQANHPQSLRSLVDLQRAAGAPGPRGNKGGRRAVGDGGLRE